MNIFTIAEGPTRIWHKVRSTVRSGRLLLVRNPLGAWNPKSAGLNSRR